MRRICLLILMAVMTVTAFAQYTKVSCVRFPQAMDIVQMMFILAFVLYSIHASASQVFGHLFCSVTK